MKLERQVSKKDVRFMLYVSLGELKAHNKGKEACR